MDKKNQFNLESYEMFSNLITEMPLIFYILDKDWNFLLSDGKGLEKLGLKPGQVVGVNAKEMYQDNKMIIHEITRAYQGERVKCYQQIGELYLENYIAPFYNGDGEVDGVFGASIDISERVNKELELSKTRSMYDALMESVPGMIYIYNAEGELVFWNKFHETMTKFSSDELKNRKLMDWYEGDLESQQAVVEGLKNADKDGFGEAETNLLCKDGSTIPMYVTASPLYMDGEKFFVGVGVDISSRKEAEHKLQELNRTLEEKVEQRTQELQDANIDLTALNEELTAMNEEMQALNEVLEDNNEKLVSMQEYLVESEKMAALGSLVAGVAHEVNTPLGIGLTAASHLSDISTELLQRHKERPLTDEDMVSYLEDIDKASQIIFKNLNRAASLVHSFKQLSVDQSMEPKREFEIGAYIEEVLISLSPSLKKTKIKIITSCPEKITMNGYPGSIAQIITNLVMNAIKHAYNPEDEGNIQIEISKHNSMVRILFSDDGKGMEDVVLSRIYEPFFTTNRSAGGTGLGLSVVYSIVTQQYQGTIKCTSKPGKGTAFKIELKANLD